MELKNWVEVEEEKPFFPANRRFERKQSPSFDRRKKTITRTFRVKSEWDDVLREEAKRQGVSVNVLVNKILRKYALYGKWTDRYDVISLPKRTFQQILKTTSIEKIANAGETSGSLDVIDILNMMGFTTGNNSFNFLLSEYFGGPDFARWFQCFHHIQGSKDVFHLQHNLGPKWSLYLERYILAYLKSLSNIAVETKIHDYAVTFKVTHLR